MGEFAAATFIDQIFIGDLGHDEPGESKNAENKPSHDLVHFSILQLQRNDGC